MGSLFCRSLHLAMRVRWNHYFLQIQVVSVGQALKCRAIVGASEILIQCAFGYSRSTLFILACQRNQPDLNASMISASLLTVVWICEGLFARHESQVAF